MVDEDDGDVVALGVSLELLLDLVGGRLFCRGAGKERKRASDACVGCGRFLRPQRFLRSRRRGRPRAEEEWRRTRVDDKVVGAADGVILADACEEEARRRVLVADDGDEEAARAGLEVLRHRCACRRSSVGSGWVRL